MAASACVWLHWRTSPGWRRRDHGRRKARQGPREMANCGRKEICRFGISADRLPMSPTSSLRCFEPGSCSPSKFRQIDSGQNQKGFIRLAPEWRPIRWRCAARASYSSLVSGPSTRPDQFLATTYHVLGIDPRQTVPDQTFVPDSGDVLLLFPRSLRLYLTCDTRMSLSSENDSDE